MSGKDPAYWPEVDVATLTSAQWQALKERVVREAGATRAHTANDLLHRLLRLYRGTAPALSPAGPACVSGRAASPRA